MRQCYRVRLPPLCKGRWVGRLRPSRWGCFFSGDLKLYRCVYCGCPTGSCRPNQKNGRAMPAPTLLIFVPTMPVGATIGRPSCRFCRKRPLSHGKPCQLPLRRGAIFHLIRRLRRHLPLKGEGKGDSFHARGRQGRRRLRLQVNNEY